MTQLRIDRFIPSRHGDRWYATSRDTKYFVKVQDLSRHRRQPHSLLETAEIMENLQRKFCQAIPQTIRHGYAKDVEMLDTTNLSSLGDLNNLYVQILENVRQGQRFSFADIAVSLLELASLGIFPNDIKLNNLGMIDSRVVIIDFDQYISISPQQIESLSGRETLLYLNQIQEQTLGFSIQPLFASFLSKFVLNKVTTPSGQIRLSYTDRAKKQFSTRNKYNNYHSFQNRKLFIEGSRGEGTRKSVLDLIKFDAGDVCLDVGANLGLVGHHLSDRGVNIYATEIDKFTRSLGQTIANLSQKSVVYVDDSVALDKKYDYALLFSVLHHMPHYIEFAKKIDVVARRVLIECRLRESGKVLSNGAWTPSGNWNFESIEQLEKYLLELFPGKRTIKCLGPSDKGRRLFELS